MTPVANFPLHATVNVRRNSKEEAFVSFKSLEAACVAGFWRLIASSWQLDLIQLCTSGDFRHNGNFIAIQATAALRVPSSRSHRQFFNLSSQPPQEA